MTDFDNEQDEKKAPECIGPCCDYDATTPHSPTGRTWRELQQIRDKYAYERLVLHGFPNPTIEMLCAKDVPTHEQYFTGVKKPVEVPKPIPGLNFTAFDFETANSYPRSACALGIVKVQDGHIIDKRYWLIKPDPFEMGFFQKKTHGIDLSSLEDKPTFQSLWPYIRKYIDGQVIVAHNAPFDYRVLTSLGEHYKLNINTTSIFCTYNVAPMFWPYRSNYRLNDICDILGIELNHHEALSDATACAQIAIEMAKLAGVNDIESLYKYRSPEIEVSSYTREPRDYSRLLGNQEKKAFFGRQPLGEADLDGLEWTEIKQESWTWADKRIVVTGEIESLTREEIVEVIRGRGGKVIGSISKSVNTVVIGTSPGPKKIAMIKELLSSGYQIELISEEVLYHLIWKEE